MLKKIAQHECGKMELGDTMHFLRIYLRANKRKFLVEGTLDEADVFATATDDLNNTAAEWEAGCRISEEIKLLHLSCCYFENFSFPIGWKNFIRD